MSSAAPSRTLAPPPSAGTRRRHRTRLVVGGLAVLTPLVLVLAVGAGSVPVAPAHVAEVLRTHLLPDGSGRVLAPVTGIEDQIVWTVRLPRVLLAFVAGAGLAVAGATLQAVVRNSLADPYVLGVASGASAAAVAVLTLGTAGTLGLSGAAFVGGTATLALVLGLGRRRGRVDPTRVLLAGVALGYLFQALTGFLQLRQGNGARLQAVLFWLLGTVSGAQWETLGLPSLLVTVGTAWLVARARSVDALVLGDEVAASLGLDVGRLRVQLLVVSALLTAAVIAVAGGVGFVGLVAPHAVRLLLGPAHRLLLPVAAVTGGVFLVLADLVGRTAARPVELPLTVVTALVGVPFFLVLLRRGGSGA